MRSISLLIFGVRLHVFFLNIMHYSASYSARFHTTKYYIIHFVLILSYIFYVIVWNVKFIFCELLQKCIMQNVWCKNIGTFDDICINLFIYRTRKIWLDYISIASPCSFASFYRFSFRFVLQNIALSYFQHYNLTVSTVIVHQRQIFFIFSPVPFHSKIIRFGDFISWIQKIIFYLR